jgi:hypothetical protein
MSKGLLIIPKLKYDIGAKIIKMECIQKQNLELHLQEGDLQLDKLSDARNKGPSNSQEIS